LRSAPSPGLGGSRSRSSMRRSSTSQSTAARIRGVSRTPGAATRPDSARGFDPRLEVAERRPSVLHDRGLGEEANELVAVAVGRALELGAAVFGRQDERVRVVDLLAAPALPALADREREPARAV